jgi:ferrous iron transport protein B
VSSVVIWFLSNFGFVDGRFGMVDDLDSGLLAAIGSLIAPLFAPLGFGRWDAAVATITGLVAKENVVGTMGVLYGFAEVAEDGAEYWTNFAAGFTPLSGFSFLCFNLYSPPCFAAIGAIRREMNNAKWTAFAIGWQLFFGYMLSLCIYQFGRLLEVPMVGDIIVGVIAFAVVFFALHTAVKNLRKGCSCGCGGCSSCKKTTSSAYT